MTQWIDCCNCFTLSLNLAYAWRCYGIAAGTSWLIWGVCCLLTPRYLDIQVQQSPFQTICRLSSGWRLRTICMFPKVIGTTRSAHATPERRKKKAHCVPSSWMAAMSLFVVAVWKRRIFISCWWNSLWFRVNWLIQRILPDQDVAGHETTWRCFMWRVLFRS